MARKKAAPKVPTVRVKKLPVVRPAIAHPYLVRFGTPHELGEPRSFQTESAARDAILKELDVWRIWCVRHNRGGLLAIQEFKTDLDRAAFHRDAFRIECCFDEYYDMWFVVEYWSTR